MKRVPLFRFVLAIFVVCVAVAAHAAEMRVHVVQNYRFMDIEGIIETGDYSRFLKIVEENQGKLGGVYLYSPGGDFLEAIKIGKALRALELSSQVPQRTRDGRAQCDEFGGSKPRLPENCTAASAAFFIHIGAVHRGGTYLAVHRPYFNPVQFKNLSQEEAQTAYAKLIELSRSYMNEMSIPAHVQEEVLNTPSDKARLLDEKTIQTHIWGTPAYRHEWLRAKCSTLSPAQVQRTAQLGSRLVAGSSLNQQDSIELRELQQQQDKDNRCEIDLVLESRKAAFTKFFGVPPSDVIKHNFSKWVDAPKYLGRTFEDLASEERFEPDLELLGRSSLSKKATSTSPETSVMDVKNKKRFVSWVSMTYPDPTDEFMKVLRETLTSAWGKPLQSDNTWRWSAKLFNAELRYENRGPTPAALFTVDAVNR